MKKNAKHLLISQEDLKALQKKTLESKFYTAIASTEAFFGNIRRYFLALTKHVAQFVKNAKDSIRVMTAPLEDLSYNPNKLILTVKEQKPAGEINARALDASNAWIYARLASWTARPLQKILQMVRRITQHILEYSESFCQLITKVKVLPEDRHVKYDVKDFFFSNERSCLVEDLQNGQLQVNMDGNYRQTLVNAFNFLPRHQFTALGNNEEEGTILHLVLKGNGMGFRHIWASDGPSTIQCPRGPNVPLA